MLNTTKIVKQFKNAKEYFEDKEFITHSMKKDFDFCPYFFKVKHLDKIVKDIEKDYFLYGSAVDTILSKEKIEDKYYIGSAPKENVEELRTKLKEVEDAMEEREGKGSKPLKSQLTSIEKLNEKIELAQSIEGKEVITEAEFEHIKQTAEAIDKQPLYDAFREAKNQVILAVEIDIDGFGPVKVKCMLDKLDVKNKIINDDKTVGNFKTLDPEIFLPQQADYRWIVRHVYGENFDCYISAGDKNKSKNFPFKRTLSFYLTDQRLAMQEAVNMAKLKEFLEVKKSGKYIPCTETNPALREERCFSCDYYEDCPHSKQKDFIIV